MCERKAYMGYGRTKPGCAGVGFAVFFFFLNNSSWKEMGARKKPPIPSGASAL